MHMLQLPWNGAVVSHIFSPRLRELLGLIFQKLYTGNHLGVRTHDLHVQDPVGTRGATELEIQRRGNCKRYCTDLRRAVSRQNRIC